MDTPQLNDLERRVVGCLIEKEMTTPDNYPLTLNALINACNQKSNRDPVMACEEAAVSETLDALRERGLIMRVHRAGDVANKYQHALRERWLLTDPELAIMSELMLRGAQTAAELRSRAERMVKYEGQAEVDEILDRLANARPPFVTKLQRRPGQKEGRWAHLLAGVPEEGAEASASEPVRLVPPSGDRLARLEEELARLRAEFEAFKRQFQ